MGLYHPENPERLEAIYAMLDGPDMRGLFREIPPRQAEMDEVCLIHSPSYVEALAATRGQEYTYLDPDTQTCEDSFDSALLAAGGLCEAVSEVHAGRLKNAFALVRPPGHHAEKSRAMGFCLLNNVAVAARYAQESLKVGKILLVDWDLHHGNGTQHAFDQDSSILYFSVHQYPFYPGTGSAGEIGKEEGKGFTINVPLHGGCGNVEYVGIFDRVLRPVALQFRPELILVSAGFDCFTGDPLGGMKVTEEGFAALTRILMEVADSTCGGKVVMTLEGGYDLRGEARCVRHVLMELSSMTETGAAALVEQGDPHILNQILEGVRSIQSPYWKVQ